MSGAVGSVIGGKKKKPAPTKVASAEPARKAEPKKPVVEVRDENSARAVTARSNRSGLTTGRSNASTRGGIRVPR